MRPVRGPRPRLPALPDRATGTYSPTLLHHRKALTRKL